MSAMDGILAWDGKGLDTDGFPPAQRYQCYDVFIQYIRLLSGNNNLYFSATATGYARDIYELYDKSPVLQNLFIKLPWSAKGQYGDVAVWGTSTNTPLSHVAIVLEDKGDNQYIFGQNQPHPYCNKRTLPSTGLLGYLRPRTSQVPVVSQPSQGNNMAEKVTQDTARILAHGVLARNGLAGRANALDGSQDGDLKKNHVGRDLTNAYVQELFLSTEGRNWRDIDNDSSLPGINRRLNEAKNTSERAKNLQAQLDGANAANASLNAHVTEVEAEKAQLEEQLKTALAELVKHDETVSDNPPRPDSPPIQPTEPVQETPDIVIDKTVVAIVIEWIAEKLNKFLQAFKKEK